jgi:concanavalin A-like lectin/glucanase superfamily protein
LTSRIPAAAVALVVALLAAAPAAASPYSDAVRADGALNYARLGDPPGSKSLLNGGVLPAGAPAQLVARIAVDGTARGPALGQPGALVGDADTAAHLDGRAPRGSAFAPAMIFGYERSLEQQHLSWEAWVKPGLVDSTSRRVMANEEPRGGTLLAARADGIVFARYLNPGQYRMYSRDSHYGAVVPKTVWGTLVAPLDHTRWSHVVATYDLVTPTTNPRGTMRLYVNGALVASRRSDFVPMLPRVSSNAYVALGSNTTGWLRYDGGLDEVATYTRTLSAAEVAEHYRIGTTGR